MTLNSVVVLIAAPGSRAIGPQVVELLRDSGAEAPRWLCPEHALEVAHFPAVGDVVAALAQAPIDINIIPAENRRKRLLVADMDSTMIEQECIDELGAAAGLKDQISAITAKAMRGELDFAAALKERVGLLAGLDAGLIGTLLATRITLMPGGPALIATMKAHGAYTALVSGGFQQFTSAIAAKLGFHCNEANDLCIENGKLTGAVREPILGADAKRAALRRLALARGLTAADAIAVGDGANDIPMLLEAGLGVALHAKPHVKAAARISIDHGDLTALLYLQAYQWQEIVLTD